MNVKNKNYSLCNSSNQIQTILFLYIRTFSFISLKWVLKELALHLPYFPILYLLYHHKASPRRVSWICCISRYCMYYMYYFLYSQTVPSFMVESFIYRQRKHNKKMEKTLSSRFRCRYGVGFGGTCCLSVCCRSKLVTPLCSRPTCRHTTPLNRRHALTKRLQSTFCAYMHVSLGQCFGSLLTFDFLYTVYNYNKYKQSREWRLSCPYIRWTIHLTRTVHGIMRIFVWKKIKLDYTRMRISSQWGVVRATWLTNG